MISLLEFQGAFKLLESRTVSLFMAASGGHFEHLQ